MREHRFYPQPAAAHGAEVPFELYNRHVYVEARIGGSGPLAFVFDTGAPATVVDLELARELGVALGGALQAAGAGGDGLRTGAFVLSAAVALPGLPGVELPIPYAVELAGLHGREGRRIDGILAWQVAGGSLLEIDYPARRLRFHNPAVELPSGGETLPMTIRHGHPHVAATLVTAAGEEVAADCVVDVGSSLGLIVTRPFAESHDLLRGARTVEDSCGAGLSGSSRARYGRLAALRLGRLEIPGVVAACSLDERGVFATSQYFEANLGGEILCRFRVVLDFGRGLLTLVPGPQAGAPGPRQSFPARWKRFHREFSPNRGPCKPCRGHGKASRRDPSASLASFSLTLARASLAGATARLPGAMEALPCSP